MAYRRTLFNTGLICVASLLGTTLVMTAATSGDLPLELDDEFRTDSIFSSPNSRTAEPAPAPAAASWSEGKVSLASLLSFQWVRQEVHLGTVEYLALAVMALYVAVYIRGRRRNYEIAHGFIKGVHGLFCSRFL